ncbi:hypothetical protein F5876DRAFT_38338 [Lentinula aff. lateritia]|uniref:Uncharacterized protein n=1 Tax=Lentinula aff. lateritia TaxID=2804960 RepID=A0ACC1U5P4_9AGAR|nr:hypothetical protein F5876DRAFT_38338 [Lentinula aff. lateritia]
MFLLGPTYISSHSADVILSDIRPIKLRIESLRCINVFLDEFLYGILNAAHSLTTDKLRAGLLSVLPTALGKEALLEAEVELRAYWDRTKPSKGGAVDDDTGTFDLQWAFELLRLKCEAYSTLNESDGDKSAEARLQERLVGTGPPPKPSLIAPAALYLTAILEHVLSNVGRVASRDSSRTYANIQDVFVALCEDETVYNLFKSMDVYQQIQQLSQEPKPRRSKSLSRNDKRSDQSSGKDSPSPPTNNRLSLDAMPPGSTRSSMDRAKGMKKLINGRNSTSNESNGHKRSESVLSDETKQTWAAYDSIDAEVASLQEFDDLMKSDATMKVSLTPDRLKTMEVYKQEKDQRGGRPKPPPLPTGNPELDLPTSIPPRPSRRPSVPNVSSIVEDEEESPIARPTHPRMRQTSVASPPPQTLLIANTRARSQSAAAPPVKRKASKTALASSSTPSGAIMQNRELRIPQPFDGPGIPQKTRKVQKNRESLDLDDVMAGSDDEEFDETEIVSPSKSFASSTPSNMRVSARTKELMDFLNDGPPQTGSNDFGGRPPINHAPVSKAGRELIDFLAEGPPDFGPPSQAVTDNGSTKSKGSGRLQRMISKLKLGESDKGSRQPSIDDLRKTPTTPSYHRPPLLMKASNGSISTFGHRPIPPRPPQTQMISPPSSPAYDPADISPSIFSPAAPSTPKEVAPVPTSVAPSQPHQPLVAEKLQQLKVSTSSRENVRSEFDLEDTKPLPKSTPSTTSEQSAPKKIAEIQPSTIRVCPPAIETSVSERKTLSPATATPTPDAAASGISIVDAQDMKRLMAKATTPEECRLIMDMFMAKAGIPVEQTEYDIPYPSPSSADPPNSRPSSSSDTALEISLVELFLGGEPSLDPPPRKKRYTTKKVRVESQATNNLQKPVVSASNGNTIPTPIATFEKVAGVA